MTAPGTQPLTRAELRRAREHAAKRQPSRSTRTLPRVGDIVLFLAATVGALSILLVIAAYAFGISLIMFSTGSMAPTITAGSVAIVKEVPASDVQIGDILTVDRDGKLPITHRVISVEPGAGADERVIQMQGDANTDPDPAPYTITEGKRVLGSIPGIAPVIQKMSTPGVLTIATLLSATLIGWTFWPRRKKKPRDRQIAEDQEDSHDQTPADTPDKEQPTPEPTDSRRARRLSALAVTAGFALAMTALTWVTPTPAHAEMSEVTTQGKYITLTTIADRERLTTLQPGRSVPWIVGVATDPPTPGMVTIYVEGDSSKGTQLTADVRACDVRWDGESCPTTAREVASGFELNTDSTPIQLTTMRSDAQLWLRFEITPDQTRRQGDVTTVSIIASGESEQLAIGPSDLAVTGAERGHPELFAIAAIGLGLSIAMAPRLFAAVRERRKASDEE